MKTVSLMGLCLAFALTVQAQTNEPNPSDSLPQLLMEAQALGLRASSTTPTSFQNIDSTFLHRFDSGKDLPMVLSQTPGMVVTSDAGAGVGYTGMRIRGSDATRINITMNGIPMNDAESQGVFWVNTPDLVSSIQSVQIQRGVGTSTNGAGAFGASVNMTSLGNNLSAQAAYKLGLGSFQTRRQTLTASTGILKNGLSLDLRLSDVQSDGYIDRASSDLQGYFLQAGWQGQKQNLQLVVFGGREQTYQAWYGIDSLSFHQQPTLNYAGALYDSNFSIVDYYDNEVDNYGQDHYQLHYGLQLSKKMSLTAALHYTRGSGYYEQYRQNEDLAYYGLPSIVVANDTIAQSDLIRRLWLDNHFYGGIVQLRINHQASRWVVGTGIHFYEGDHFGDLQWMRYAATSEIRDRFYFNRSNKTDANAFVKWEYDLAKNWTLFADLQMRVVRYSGNGTDEGNLPVDFEDNLLFFNPKFGFVHQLTKHQQLYFSYALAHREGNRADYLFGSPVPEQLHNTELGWRKASDNFQLQLNAYGMFYTNQLVLTGEIDNVGGFIRRNIGRSYRIGLEAQSEYWLTKNWSLQMNLAISDNRNQQFVLAHSDGTTENIGNTPIAYSPALVGGWVLNYQSGPWLASWSSRYVGSQYLSNEARPAHLLSAYWINDVRLGWKAPEKWIGSPLFSLDLFNLLNEKYASNGYVYAGEAYYYAQAGRHFMCTATWSF